MKIERQSQVLVQEKQLSNNSRITETQIGKKKIITPCYFSKIHNPNEIDLICDERKINNQHQGVFFDITSIDHINRQKKVITTNQQQLMPVLKFDFRTLKDILPTFIDPNMEYFYFNNASKRSKYTNLLGIPRSIQGLLKTSTTVNHDKKWLELDKAGDINSFINWSIREQNKYQPDGIIPTIPFISDEESELVDLAIDLNKKASFAIAEVNKLEPTFYFPMNYLALRDINQLTRISDFLMDSDDDYHDVKLTFIKIKNFSETDTDGIRNLGIFIRKIREATRYNGKCTFLIDADSYGFACIANGLDGFCEPLDGHIHDYGGYKKKKGKKQSNYGNWYNRTKMKSDKFKNVKNKVLNCSCPICKNINENFPKVNEKNIDVITWNRWRKEHLFYSRCDEITEVRKLITNKEIMKIMDKFTHSAHKPYIEILGLYNESG